MKPDTPRAAPKREKEMPKQNAAFAKRAEPLLDIQAELHDDYDLRSQPMAAKALLPRFSSADYDHSLF